MRQDDRRVLLAAVAAAALGPLSLWPGRAAPAAPGDAVQWPQVGLFDGGRWGAAQAEGKAVVAVFWSTTCPFCRRHNAHVEKLREAAAGRPLEVITVARDKDPQAVQRYRADAKGKARAGVEGVGALAELGVPTHELKLSVHVAGASNVLEG